MCARPCSPSPARRRTAWTGSARSRRPSDRVQPGSARRSCRTPALVGRRAAAPASLWCPGRVSWEAPPDIPGIPAQVSPAKALCATPVRHCQAAYEPPWGRARDSERCTGTSRRLIGVPVESRSCTDESPRRASLASRFRSFDAFNGLLVKAYILDGDGRDTGPWRHWAGQFAAYIPAGSAGMGVGQVRRLLRRRPVVRFPRGSKRSGVRASASVCCAAVLWGVGSRPLWVERGACSAPAAALRASPARCAAIEAATVLPAWMAGAGIGRRATAAAAAVRELLTRSAGVARSGRETVLDERCVSFLGGGPERVCGASGGWGGGIESVAMLPRFRRTESPMCISS